MQDEKLYPRFRFTMGVLDILCTDLTHVVNMLAAPMLVFLASDFGLDAATAGYASTLHLLFQGIFMFIGPVMIGWLDNKKTQFIGLTTMVIGSALSFSPCSCLRPDPAGQKRADSYDTFDTYG